MNHATALTPATRILLLLAAASVALWGMSNYASYINSAALAILVVLACGPVVDWLRRRGLPNWASLLITLALSLFVLGVAGLFLLYATAEFAKSLPTYQQQAEELAQQIQAWLQSLGLSETGASAIADPTTAISALTFTHEFLSELSNLLSNGVMLLMLMIFLFVDVILFPGRLAWQGAHGSSYARRLGDFTGDLRQYMVVMVILGVIVGTLNTILFVVVGVELPLLWGVLSGILNFIPFIGFWFALIPPAILTLLEYGPQRMLVMSFIYIIINAIVSNVIQPRLVVVRLNLTPFFNLVSCTFWPIVLGTVGAIIGVPLTMAVYSLLLDADPTTRWLASMMSATVPDQTASKDAAQGSAR